MQNKQLKLILLFCLVVMVSVGWSAVTEYTFTSTTGTYTPITDGTLHGTDANDEQVFNNVPLGFTFNFNGVDYTSVSIATNGFIAMGSTVTTSNTAISTGATNNVISIMNRDIKSRANGTLLSLLSGEAPNRVFTIQWAGYRRSSTSTANDTLNFQIKLFEQTNAITYNYGQIYAVTFSAAQNFQVGLRGASNTEFFNRTTTTNWSATTIGLANNASCVLSNTVFPANGLIFTWSPASIDPPPPAQITSPANGAIDVALTSTLNWASNGGAPTGYKVYLGTDNPPTNLVNGTTTTATTFNPDPDFIYNTVYYWKIVPFNANGDAINCPVWSFTSMLDPTVLTFPYTQNWDAVTAPIIPSSWTVVNVNNDASSWQTVSTGAYSAPNAARIAFGSVPMDDWLISPPLSLVGGTYYRIQFRFKAQNVSFPEKMEIKFGNANNPAALTEQIYNNTSITNTGYSLGEAFMSPAVNGIYYFGFHGYSAANMYYIFLDDIAITEVIPVFNPPQDLEGITGNGTVALTWEPPLPARALRGYHVYRNNVEINTELVMTTSFVDTTAPIGVLATYHVTAVYVSPNGVSDPSNVIDVTPTVNPPINLVAVSGINQVSLTWQAPIGFIPFGYNVYKNGIQLNTNPITEPAYVDNNVSVGFASSYYVTSVYTNPALESGPSATVMGESVNPPTELTATPGNASVILNWVSPIIPHLARTNHTNFRDLLGYYVYRDTLLIHTINNIDITTYTVTGLMPGTYSFSVTAHYTSGESAPAGPVSAIVTTAFIAPTNLVAVGSASGIALTWDAPDPLLPNFSGYRVFRDGISISHSLVLTNSYNDTEIISGVTYSYYVVARYINPAGNSSPSNTVQASGGEPLNPVYNLQHSVAQNDVNLTWTPPGGPIYQDWIRYDDGVPAVFIGTNAAANFDAAIRFTQTELTGLANRYITKVRFIPHVTACEYSVKVWTGGSSLTNAGTLVVTVPVPNPVMDTWNVVTLPTPIQIPTVGELRVGVNANTQTGYPLGCDDGPSFPTKSNLIFLDNAWTTLTTLNQELDYNWNIQAFATNFINRETVLVQSGEIDKVVSSQYNGSATFGFERNPRREKFPVEQYNDRALEGYRVYRNGVAIANISEITTPTYDDLDLDNGSYVYTVTAVYTTGESVHCDPVTAVINEPVIPIIYEDNFEAYDNFALTIPFYSMLDVDASSTYGINGTDFTNEESPMAFMVFNPSATTPAMTELSAHSGSKMLASFAATTAPNNDWIITRQIRLGTVSSISLWVKSYTAEYGLERFKVGVSSAANPIPLSFSILSGPTYVEAPTEWTRFIYDVPATFNATTVRFGIKCESNDAFIFFVDDIVIKGQNGYVVSNNEEITPVVETMLLSNFPNPFNPETSISYNLKADEQVCLEIYNLKGQKVKTLVNEKVKAGSHKVTWKGDDDNGKPVSSGVYFYRMNSGNYSSSKKMILMK